ncbi:MAG TPA: hypothetical protein VHX38_18870 [Pseudonocardiaceae bacterium]|jgi:hypothetical protein|nr:hypothetical protein [Pseudonocardiaceae bacterium]
MSTPTAPDVSIHDFTLTVDTEATAAAQREARDKVICRLERDGESITMECSAAQLVWVIEDRDLFTGWYAQAIAQRAAAAAAPEQVTAG